MKEIRDVINENTKDDFVCNIKYNYEFNLAGDFKDKEPAPGTCRKRI